MLYGMMKWVEKTLLLYFSFSLSIYEMLEEYVYTCYKSTLNIDYAHHIMILCLNLEDDVCINAWMHGWNSRDPCLLFFFTFPFIFSINVAFYVFFVFFVMNKSTIS